MKINTVFHPTSFCNLACRYCWSPDKDEKRKMPLAVVEESLRQVYSNRDLEKNDILWLTGEPLVVGLDHFNSAVSLVHRLRPNHFETELMVQSNGTLINDDWAKFFKANGFVVGVTIDGPKHIHDRQRVSKGGAGTFDAALRGINHLVEHGVKGGALCVITRATLEASPDDLFFFFYDRGIPWSYLIEARIGENVASDEALSLADLPKLEAFFGRLIELWGKYPSAFIRDIDQLTRRLFGDRKFESNYTNLGCLDILNVTAEGDFFWGNPELLSATKSDLRDIRFNLSKDDVWGSRSSPGFQKVEAEIHRGVEKCHNECPYFVGCQGGNPAHKFYEHKRFDVSSHVSCRLNDQIIPHLLLDRIENALPA